MSPLDIAIVALVVAGLIVWHTNALLAYRRNRRWRRHVDAALALGSRRPQDALNEARWPT